MAEKRRDNKGRILRTGESQRKDGRYAYKYTDSTGKPQFVYAWKLVATDKTPTGKRDDISLREKEAEINRDIADGIDAVGKKMTVCQLYAKQNSQRADVKRATKKQREYLMGLLRDDPLGRKSIDAVKPSDAKEWAIRMKEKGFSFQSISNYKRSLRAAFFIAIEDDCVRKNPFSFALRNLLKKYNKQHKEPLPNITPHSFRHTFCTRMANAGMNPKALQYIMGHANITMTLDYYTHVDACSVRAEMERLAA